ncbi:hypothetical protein QWZ13_02820 [Reinekea marina]|uniref:Uncharacterized protein n=1 Tax=Reinekea marina TaxID=1310421 RepID=A0ABV7WNQ3_9GAMM|nr:hypothetical protein [Reinekea marina]MDN3647843.1 hypothetical protein [Reinekea marina]
MQIDDAVVTLTNNDQGVISLKLGQSTQLKGCTLTYLWRNEPYPVKKGVSNENPKAHVQLLYDCL